MRCVANVFRPCIVVVFYSGVTVFVSDDKFAGFGLVRYLVLLIVVHIPFFFFFAVTDVAVVLCLEVLTVAL